MRKLLLSVLLCSTTFAFGQKLDFGLSIGTGKSYFFETLYKSSEIKYGLPLSFLTELKYTPKDKKWGVKLRLQNIESTVKGQNWVDKTPLNGYINSFTTSILLENEIIKKNFIYGFNFGLGLTNETMQPLQYSTLSNTTKNYTSITVGGHLTYRIDKNLDFQILPTLFWQDPLKSIAVWTGSGNANVAGEDLTILINFGVRYRLTK